VAAHRYVLPSDTVWLYLGMSVYIGVVCIVNLTVDSVLIRYLRLGVDDGHLILMATQDDATTQSVSSF